MQKIVGSLLILLSFAVWHWLARPKQIPIVQDAILSVTMNLSAFGVESDTYPSIAATLNFEQHTSYCKRSYYNPAYPVSIYRLSAEEMSQIKSLLQQADLAKLKSYYSVGTRSDQPTSTIVIRTSSRLFTIKDYGLEGAAPLPDIYRIVYKMEY